MVEVVGYGMKIPVILYPIDNVNDGVVLTVTSFLLPETDTV